MAWSMRRRGPYAPYGDAGLQLGRHVIFHVGYVGGEWTYAVTLGRAFIAVHW